MASWHQEKSWKLNGAPELRHPTRWSSYNPRGHLSVMRHGSKEDCMEYCKNTGDIPLEPINYSKG